MPVGGPSSQPFQSSDFTADNASTWKAKQDANSAIISPFGALYVYANSPAAMNVKVDVAAVLAQAGFAGAPFLLNAGATPVTVSLAAPGSNKYYGTIYWDVQAQGPGVVYGTASASPSPVLPDMIWQVPIAIVLIQSTDTTIQPTAITDVRYWFDGTPLTLNVSYAAAAAANKTIECNGASEINIFHAGWTSGSGTITYTLNNLRVGANVNVSVYNNSGSTITFKIAATTPGGVAYQAAYALTGAGASFTLLSATGAGIVTSRIYNFALVNYLNVATPQLFGPLTIAS
jgi:hypothetical protein